MGWIRCDGSSWSLSIPLSIASDMTRSSITIFTAPFPLATARAAPHGGARAEAAVTADALPSALHSVRQLTGAPATGQGRGSRYLNSARSLDKIVGLTKFKENSGWKVSKVWLHLIKVDNCSKNADVADAVGAAARARFTQMGILAKPHGPH